MTRLPRRRLTALVAVPLSVLVVATGCSSSDDSEPKGAPTELRLAIGGEDEAGYDPTLGWGRYGSPLFQSTLLQRNADLSFGNDLATGHSVSDDALTWTVDIRTDAKFSDGEPVTAEDVAYTFTTASEQGGLTDVTALKEARVIDEDTVEFELKAPQSTFVNRLASLGIVPEHAHGEGYAQKPVGSGPFTLVNWTKGQQLVVARNDDYYGQKPAFEKVTFVFTDEDASLAAAKAGQVDLVGLPSSLASQQLPGMRLEEVTSIDNRGIGFPTVPAEGKKSPSGLPVGNDVTAELAMRQAVNLAVNRKELVAGVLDGFGSPAFGPVDNSPWFNEETTFEDDDVDGAKKLLADAGWKDSDGDGVVEKGDTKASFTLLYPAGDSLRQGLSLSVVDQVKRAGIEITTEGVSWDEIYKRLHVDAVMFGWGSHDPYEMYSLYKSDLAGTDLYNSGYYANDHVDGFLDAALEATDDKTAVENWKKAQPFFSGTADAPWAWLVNLKHTYFVDECLDLGASHVEPHGHGWPITASITQWAWTC